MHSCKPRWCSPRHTEATWCTTISSAVHCRRLCAVHSWTGKQTVDAQGSVLSVVSGFPCRSWNIPPAGEGGLLHTLFSLLALDIGLEIRLWPECAENEILEVNTRRVPGVEWVLKSQFSHNCLIVTKWVGESQVAIYLYVDKPVYWCSPAFSPSHP